MRSVFSNLGSSLREQQQDVFERAQRSSNKTNFDLCRVKANMDRLEEEAELISSLTQRVHNIIMSIIKNI